MRIAFLGVSFLFLCSVSIVHAQDAGKAGQVSTSERQLQEEREFRKRIEKQAEVEPPEEPAFEKQELPQGTEKVYIESITVSGVTQFSKKKINELIAPFQHTEVTLADMQKAADLITDLYRSNGFITSRAYLPPQKMTNQVLEIRVIEGLVGDTIVTGNRFFRKKRIAESVGMEKGEIFNHTTLRENLRKVNELPDRNVKAVLAPGKETGTTDVNLEVKDRLPLHAEIGWDNWGSRYIRKNHYNGVFTDNNLLGFDDILTVNYQFADANDYHLESLRYLFPVTSRMRLGAFVSQSKIELGQEYKDVMARSKSRMVSVYGMYDVITKDMLAATLNFGFDYKDNVNFQMGEEESKDRMRVPKLGLDIDVSDKWNGRTIIAPEVQVGIPDFMGGLDTTDVKASRVGSGGRFVKENLKIARLQDMPYDTALLLKNQFQFTPHVLTATEQFQLGGISNNRGYPSGERVGDEGGASTAEFSIPVYGVPKDMTFPFMKEKIYDSLRLAAFYDFGYTHLHEPVPGEHRYNWLHSAGWGVRVNLPRNFSFTADFAWPLGNKTPSDEDHFHPWLSVAKKF